MDLYCLILNSLKVKIHSLRVFFSFNPFHKKEKGEASRQLFLQTTNTKGIPEVYGSSL